MAEMTHFFPLSAYKAKVGLDETYRAQLRENVENDYEDKKFDYKADDTAWTGDVRGFEFLHLRDIYEPLFRTISGHVREYYKILNVAGDVFDFYYTRTWATVTQTQQDIPAHRHKQSHITAVYYLNFPEEAGKLIFEPDWDHVQNESIPGLLSGQNVKNGLIQPSMFLSPAASIDIATDDVVIFPSKASHGTAKSNSREKRISISADIVAVLKESGEKEFFLPPLDKWKKFS
jgi:uncharacterized protein (TIGR02466 family)